MAKEIMSFPTKKGGSFHSCLIGVSPFSYSFPMVFPWFSDDFPDGSLGRRPSSPSLPTPLASHRWHDHHSWQYAWSALPSASEPALLVKAGANVCMVPGKLQYHCAYHCKLMIHINHHHPPIIWVNCDISLTWIKTIQEDDFPPMVPVKENSEVVIIYQDGYWNKKTS